MKKFTFTAICAACLVSLPASADEEKGKLIFKDDFERKESQETTDEVGNGWKTNSKSRAKGNKQVDLKDGSMHIFIHKEADHAVSVVHELGFKDGYVKMRFMLPNGDDQLGLNFADPTYKKVHAGHLCMARINSKQVTLLDLKTGNMDLERRNRRKEGKATPEDKKITASKQKKIPNKLEPGKWYDLVATIKGESLSVSVDGKEVGSFSSEGIAHPMKRLLRLSVPKKAVVDDVQFYSTDQD